MIETPQLFQTIARHTAFIPLTIPKPDMRVMMGPALAELMATVAAQGVKMAGPWFTHHLRIVPDIWDFEIGVPLKTPVVAAGRVTSRHEASIATVRTVYHGPYEGLGRAWDAFTAWIAAEGHTTPASFGNVISSDPTASPTRPFSERTSPNVWWHETIG